MKKICIITLFSLLIGDKVLAQYNSAEREKFGNTLNLAAGLGYYGYLSPLVHVNYEFDIFRNFTLAPFVSAFTYQSQNYWGDPGKPVTDPSYHYYNYREVVVPVGVKGTYYFDQLLHASSKWDFYVATSIGFSFRSVIWDNGYYGDRTEYKTTSPLYVNMHIGSEYHLSQKAGLFLDLSTGVSTFGLAVHF